ncbi:MAG: hypothetical protein AAF438_23215 [Pseudomonadota bacterium]
MAEKTYLLMQPTEMEVFQAASRIYSAIIQSSSVESFDKASAMERAVKEAIELAQLTDDLVQSDGELN